MTPSRSHAALLLPAAILLTLLALACDESPDAPADIAPAGATTGLAATVATATVGLTWVNPTDVDYGITMIVRYAGGVADGEPRRGDFFTVGESFGSGVVVYVGGGLSAIDMPDAGCGIVYQAWTRDIEGNWCLSPQEVRVNVGVSAPTPTAPPSGLMAAVAGADVLVTWTNPPAGSGYSRIRVLRTSPVPPTGPSDGTVVHDGAGTNATDALPGLVALTQYHYAAYACNDCGQCEPTGTTVAFRPMVMQSLGAGGYTLAWRHASATTCSDRTDLGTASTTTAPNWWKSCATDCPPAGTATARQLNAAGVTEATTIGNDFRARGVTVGRVISSEFCRCTTTAQLMAFGPPIEERQDMTYFVHDEASRCANWTALLAQPPAASTNTATIGHAGFLCPVLDSLAWGEAAIYKPDGAGGARYITRVMWNQWATLP